MQLRQLSNFAIYASISAEPLEESTKTRDQQAIFGGSQTQDDLSRHDECRQ